MNDFDREDAASITSHIAATLTLIAVVLVAIECGPPTGHAQHHDEALTIAQLVVHESGWDHVADAAAIVAVLRNGGSAVSMSPAAFARVYSPRFTRRQVARTWVYRLTADARDPHAGIRWASYVDRWRAILEATQAALAADGVACEASDWGSDSDLRRARALGRRFREVDCGDTRNHYLVRYGRESVR